jgi:hypothetical protein
MLGCSNQMPDKRHSISTERGPHLSELARIRTGEVLSGITRTERKILLGVSMLGVTVAHTGLIPSKITALGVEFEHADQQALLLMLVVVVAYFTIAFIVYATADFLAWRASHDETLLMHLQHEHAFLPIPETAHDEPAERALKQIRRRVWWWGTLARKTSYLRALWEFVLPILAGAYSIGVLLWARHHIL